jgi:hypothetical protein
MKPTRTQQPVTPISKKEYYDGAELKPFSGRTGALDAYKLPSIRGGKPVEPSLYMTKYEGESK